MVEKLRAHHGRGKTEKPKGKGGRPPKVDSGIKLRAAVLTGTVPHAGGAANELVLVRLRDRLLEDQPAKQFVRSLDALSLDAAAAAVVARGGGSGGAAGGRAAGAAAPAAAAGAAPAAPSGAELWPWALTREAYAAKQTALAKLQTEAERLANRREAESQKLWHLQFGQVSMGNRAEAASDAIEMHEAELERLDGAAKEVEAKRAAVVAEMKRRRTAGPAAAPAAAAGQPAAPLPLGAIQAIAGNLSG